MEKTQVSKATVLTIMKKTGVMPGNARFNTNTEDREVLTCLHRLFVDYAQIRRMVNPNSVVIENEYRPKFHYSISAMLPAEFAGSREILAIPIDCESTYNSFKELILDYYAFKPTWMYDTPYQRAELEQAIAVEFPPIEFDGWETNWDIPICPELAGNMVWAHCLFT